MSHLQLAVVLLALLLVYGVVGRMDYEDAIAAEQRNGKVRLLCVRRAVRSAVAGEMLRRRAEFLLRNY